MENRSSLIFEATRQEVEKAVEAINNNLKISMDRGDRVIFLQDILADSNLPYCSDWTNKCFIVWYDKDFKQCEKDEESIRQYCEQDIKVCQEVLENA